MNIELKKRLITSIFLFLLLYLMFSYTYILVISLIVIGIVSWVEFYALISKILIKESFKEKLLRFIYKAISLLYLSVLIFFIISAKSTNTQFEIVIVYSILVSVVSDIGGLVIGKIFKGKKLTKISPKKTISGSFGSFIFSLSLIPFFSQYLFDYNFLSLFLFTLIISLFSQLGDLFISFLKRLAKVKDTSDLLPGHGGVLDRIDGIIFAIPISYLIFSFL
jgi:phosphatidate cytidylyltransferase|tara:strand:+ start:699 stop:1361 length:663 start_codon:yes stop_codon:yes gene_type:complete